MNRRNEMTTREQRIEAAAQALVDDARRRHPGEPLPCPLLRALDEALRSPKDAPADLPGMFGGIPIG